VQSSFCVAVFWSGYKSISNTSLFTSVWKDGLIWKKEKTGCYIVKSTYRLWLEEIVDNSYLHQHHQWACIWKLKVPPKVKHLKWGICWGCLPKHKDRGRYNKIILLKMQHIFYLIPPWLWVFGRFVTYGRL